MSHTQGQSGMSAQAQSRTSYEQGGQVEAGQGGFPVSNTTYNLISMLHSKLEGLAAYKKYLQDAQGDENCTKLIQEMQESDAQMARRIQAELASHMSQEGQH